MTLLTINCNIAILKMTPFIKKDIKNDWYLINAENVVVGRLAAYISLYREKINQNSTIILIMVIL